MTSSPTQAPTTMMDRYLPQWMTIVVYFFTLLFLILILLALRKAKVRYEYLREREKRGLPVSDDIMSAMAMQDAAMAENKLVRAVDYGLFHSTPGRILDIGMIGFLDDIEYVWKLLLVFQLQTGLQYFINQSLTPASSQSTVLIVIMIGYLIFKVFKSLMADFVSEKLGPDKSIVPTMSLIPQKDT